MNTTEKREAQIEALPPSQKERAIHAKKTYCKACEEHGVKACSWDSFSGYQDYVSGRIGENELSDRASEELKNFTQTFGKYTVVEKEEPVDRSPETKTRERARVANKVYKKVCSESGLNSCFFSGFGAWSDYVQGRIDEAEFSEKARVEVEQMKANTAQ